MDCFNENSDDKEISAQTWNKLHETAKTSGYREGISNGRETNFQNSFDEGYSDGFKNSFALGMYKGYLSATDKCNNEKYLEKVSRGNCQTCNKSIFTNNILEILRTKHLLVDTNLPTQID